MSLGLRLVSQLFIIGRGSRRATQVTRGGAGSPSWSPSGKKLAIVQRGWITVIDRHGRMLTRLARGAAPAWSPDGREIAFVAGHDRIATVPAAGGTTRFLGGVRGLHVDWQPIPAWEPKPCEPLPRARTVLSTPKTVITTRSGPDPYDSGTTDTSWLGCLRSDGLERVIATTTAPEYDGTNANDFTTTGPYLAFVYDVGNHYYGDTSTIETIDLRTGRQTNANELPTAIEGTATLPSLVLTPEGTTGCDRRNQLEQQYPAKDVRRKRTGDHPSRHSHDEGPQRQSPAAALSAVGNSGVDASIPPSRARR